MTLFVYSFQPLCPFFCDTFLPNKTFDIYWCLAFCSFTIPAWSLSGPTTGIGYVILIFALLCVKKDTLLFHVWSLWKFIYIRVLKGILLGWRKPILIIDVRQISCFQGSSLHNSNDQFLAFQYAWSWSKTEFYS